LELDLWNPAASPRVEAIRLGERPQDIKRLLQIVLSVVRFEVPEAP
jgi:hypothetical protein